VAVVAVVAAAVVATDVRGTYPRQGGEGAAVGEYDHVGHRHFRFILAPVHTYDYLISRNR
jgi:hypothetical protein